MSMRIFHLAFDDETITTSLRRTLKPHAFPVVTSAVDETGTLLATGGSDGITKVWDIQGGFTTHTFHGHAGVVSALCFFKVAAEEQPKKKRRTDEGVDDLDSFRLASGDEHGQIRVWNLSKRKGVATLTSHVSVVRALDFDTTTQLLLSASRDQTVLLWDASTWQLQTTIPAMEAVEGAGFVPNARLVFAAGESGKLRFWWANGRPAVDEADKGQSVTHAVCVGSDVVTIHIDQEVRIHTLEVPEYGTKMSPGSVRRVSGTLDEVIDLAYIGPDHLAVATNLEEVKIISLAGENIAHLEGHTDIVISMHVDASGEWLATAAKDNTARLWRLNMSKREFSCHATFVGHAESLSAVAMISSGMPSSIITASQDKTIKRWDVPAVGGTVNRALYTRKAHDKDMNALAISPDNQVFASASQDRTVKVWSVDDGETLGVLRGHKRGVWSVAFAPAAATLGERGATIKALIATASGDKTVKLWSLRDYSCVRTFEGHTNTVLKVVWLPPAEDQDTHQVASAASDGLVKVWNLTSGELACTLDNHTDRVWALAVAPGDSDSRRLASGAADAVVTVWRDTSAATAQQAAAADSRRVEQAQQLDNLVRAGDVRGAIVLALALNHPARLLGLFATAGPANSSAGAAADAAVASLDDTQLLALLGRVRDWNASGKHAPVAQRVLHAVFKSYPAARLVEMARSRAGGELGDILHALVAYGERHYRRVCDVAEQGWVVEYTLRQMGVGGDGIGAAGKSIANGIANGADVVHV